MSIKIVRKKLQRHGNSMAVVIDRPILDLLGWTSDTTLELVARRNGGLELVRFEATPDLLAGLNIEAPDSAETE